ncbi:MAG TPA: c-type cytochrome [Quisquiliibacterium sp.]|nr:c-type cytochrome [Quisquiliibacterium sp.]HQD83942.1 c-type cytochrome [Quisquiliibacterium sp.]HQN11603.1 c-type cytochrome [Quisquiliibacterium sp.]
MTALLLGCVLAAIAPLAAAATATATATAAVDARAATARAPVEDTIAQRVLACTGCHGAEGRAARDGYYPRIAGKPAEYLFRQLRAFRDGQRRYPLMAGLLAPLDDAYLREIAAHFAAQDLPYPPATPSTAQSATLTRGRALALQGDPARRLPACARCHGDALTGVGDTVPGLLGLPRDYLVAQIGAWRTGNRHADAPDCMAEIARQLEPRDVEAVAHWLAAQPMPERHRPAPSTPEPAPLRCGSMAAPGSAR